MSTKTVIKIHFGLLLFLVLHFFLQNAYGFGLNTSVRFGIKLVIYGTGIGLFFSYFKRKSWLKYYASLYVLLPVVVFLGYLLDGILGAILGSVFFLFLYLPTSVATDKNYTVKTEYAGLLNACCFMACIKSALGSLKER